MSEEIKKQDQSKEPANAAELGEQDMDKVGVTLSDAELDQAAGGLQNVVVLPAKIAPAGGGTTNIRGTEDMVGCRH